MSSSIQLRDDYDADELRALSFSYISGRPQHQRSASARRVKKNFPSTLAAHIGHLPKDKPIEI